MTESDPQMIFHYTDRRGLLGILTSRSIWATDIYCLNDVSEFRHGMKITIECLDSKISGATGKARDLLTKIRIQMESAHKLQVYVSSFSEEGNLLSQWRAYGSKGNGFSLGFDLADLTGMVASFHNDNMRLARCIYDTSKQEELINALLDSFLPYLDEDYLIENLSAYNAIILLYAPPLLKAPAFREEREWRIIRSNVGDDSTLKFRDSGTMLSSYIELPLPQKDGMLSVKKIIVGPTAHTDATLRSLHQLLHTLQIESCKVEVSDIPFQDW